MPAITSSNLAEAILRYVAAETMPALVGQLMMGNLVYRNFETTINQAGSSVDIPIPPVMVANNIAETGSVQLQAPNLGNANISLDSHVEASFQIPDVVAVIGHPELIKLYSGPALNAVAERMETDLLSLATAFTANTPVGAYNTAITEATVDNAETTLFNAKVPQIEPKILVVDGSTYSTLRQITRFSEYRTAGEAGPGVSTFPSENVLASAADSVGHPRIEMSRAVQ